MRRRGVSRVAVGLVAVVAVVALAIPMGASAIGGGGGTGVEECVGDLCVAAEGGASAEVHPVAGNADAEAGASNSACHEDDCVSGSAAAGAGAGGFGFAVELAGDVISFVLSVLFGLL